MASAASRGARAIVAAAHSSRATGSSSLLRVQYKSFTSATTLRADNSSSSSSESGKQDPKKGAKPQFNTEPEKNIDHEDVRLHNEEVDRRKAKAAAQGGGSEGVPDEVVDKEYWTGSGARKDKEGKGPA